MKTYEKPRLIALSLGGNDRLCGDCANREMTLWNHSSVAAGILEVVGIDPNDNGVSGIDRDDFSSVFGDGDGCAHPVTMYCKFTSATTVAWS